MQTVRIGTMQGRLLPPYEGRFQAFPASQWREEFTNAQKAGLYCIEWIYEQPHEDENPLRTDEGLAQMKAAMVETGVKVVSICADYYMTRPLVTDAEGVDLPTVDHLRWLMGRAQALGATYIVLPFVDASSLKTEDARQNLIALLKQLGPEAQKLGVELHMETDFPPPVFSAILSAIDHPNIRWNYDIGNSASLGFAANDEFDAQGKYLGSVHIKDRVRGSSTVPLGTGDAEVDVSLKRILETGFDRWFILQVARDKAGEETAWLASVRQDVERRLAALGKI
jgi:L-ribulose-5-phosphate 3-epimerase